VFEGVTVPFFYHSRSQKAVIPVSGTVDGVPPGIGHSMILCPCRYDTGSMTKKEKVMKVVDESTGLMECLVCGAKHNAVMKPGPDGKYLPENWECVNKCTLIHHEEKSSKKR